MWKSASAALLILAACAQPLPAPPLRVQLMNRCAAACEPAQVVQALVAVDGAADLWQCLCKAPEAAVKEGI
jgi:hypothetical protein